MSAANSEMVNRLAFVGNLPPDATQEEMKQLCSQVGEVILFRIVLDRETGKPKGYGFCEYRDPKLVDVAVDLLNDFEHRGSKLYVSKANSKHQHPNRSNHNDSGHGGSNSSTPSSKPSKKKARKASSKRKSVDEITRVVSSFSTSEKREILSQMKVLIEQNEKGAKDILLENPQLAQALLLIQMEFNLVKTTDIHALTKTVSNEVPQPKPKAKPQTIQQQPPLQQSTNTPQQPQQQQQQQQQQQHQQQHQQQTQQSAPKQPVKSQQAQPQIKPQSNANNNIDNDVQMKNNNNNNNNANPKPAATASKVNEDKLKRLSSQQQNVLGRVMKMTPEQIAALPPDVQRQIRAVQAQLAKRQNKQ